MLTDGRQSLVQKAPGGEVTAIVTEAVHADLTTVVAEGL
jgi:hypothetical protein